MCIKRDINELSSFASRLFLKNLLRTCESRELNWIITYIQYFSWFFFGLNTNYEIILSHSDLDWKNINYHIHNEITWRAQTPFPSLQAKIIINKSNNCVPFHYFINLWALCLLGHETRPNKECSFGLNFLRGPVLLPSKPKPILIIKNI